MKKKYVLKNKKRFLGFITFIILVAITVLFTRTVYAYKEITYTTVQVRQGDTLWGIAKEFSKSDDVRKLIYEIKKVNKLENSNITQGDELKIPV
jgi:LysM repeat protein